MALQSNVHAVMKDAPTFLKREVSAPGMGQPENPVAMMDVPTMPSKEVSVCSMGQLAKLAVMRDALINSLTMESASGMEEL